MRLPRPRVVVTDVDGTLTSSRTSYELVPEAVWAIQELARAGIGTVLATANAFPVAMGLARYLGAVGVVAENGCMVAYRRQGGLEIRQLCEWVKGLAPEDLEEALKGLAVPSWQNPYRRCDFAFVPVDKRLAKEALERLKAFLAERGYEGALTAEYSGYALHVRPSACSKLRGVRELMAMLGIPMEDVMAIGDSEMDAEMVKEAGLGVAVDNSDEGLKRVARYVTRLPSGYGFVEAVETLVLSRLMGHHPGSP